ncbi:fucolectin-5-like [Branchiostoma floridae x Branchiostoma japonicum]
MNEYQPWWKVDLSSTYAIKRISILNRGDCCGERLKNFMVRVGPNEDFAQNDQCGEMYTETPKDGQTIVVYCSPPIPGRYVSIQLMGRRDELSLCEVEVYAETGQKHFIFKYDMFISMKAHLCCVGIIHIEVYKKIAHLEFSVAHPSTFVRSVDSFALSLCLTPAS